MVDKKLSLKESYILLVTMKKMDMSILNEYNMYFLYIYILNINV